MRHSRDRCEIGWDFPLVRFHSENPFGAPGRSHDGGWAPNWSAKSNAGNSKSWSSIRDHSCPMLTGPESGKVNLLKRIQTVVVVVVVAVVVVVGCDPFCTLLPFAIRSTGVPAWNQTVIVLALKGALR